MINSKQRAKLKGIASTLDPIFQVGVNGVNDELVLGLDKALENRELVKVKILQNCEVDAKTVYEELTTKLNAEQVCLIGKTMVLYRISKKKNFKHIEI